MRQVDKEVDNCCVAPCKVTVPHARALLHVVILLILLPRLQSKKLPFPTRDVSKWLLSLAFPPHLAGYTTMDKYSSNRHLAIIYQKQTDKGEAEEEAEAEAQRAIFFKKPSVTKKTVTTTTTSDSRNCPQFHDGSGRLEHLFLRLLTNCLLTGRTSTVTRPNSDGIRFTPAAPHSWLECEGKISPLMLLL